jgi:hypothetical protein
MASGIKTGGRKAGVPNKRTQDLQDRLEALGVDPLEGLALIAKDDTAPLELRARVQMDLMNYLYPRRKALDVGSSNQQPVSIRIGLSAPLNQSTDSACVKDEAY